MTPRDQFASLLAEHSAARAAEYALMREGGPDDETYKQRIYAAAREAGYRGKEPPWESSAKLSKAALDACMKVKEAFLAEWKPRLDAAEAKTKAIADQLFDLAPGVEIKRADTSLVLRREDPDYRQGDAYAEGSCRLSAKKCEAFGVRAEVVRIAPVENGRVRPAAYECRAFVAEDLDIEVLKRLHLPVREQVRLCWSMALNPRVYWPMLPHGYEEREGIDFQGRDLRKPENAGIVKLVDERPIVDKAAHALWDFDAEPAWDTASKSWKIELRGNAQPAWARVYPGHVLIVQRIESNLFRRCTVVLGAPLLTSAWERVEWSWDDSPEQRSDALFNERKELCDVA